MSMSAYRRLFLVAAVVVPAMCFAKPNVESGKTTFNTLCAACHSVVETGGPVMGPNLLGVPGRKAGTSPEFAAYTPFLKDSRITWSKKTLDKFLLSPGDMVQNTSMPMQITDKKTRADVVAYLLTLKK